MKKPVFLSLIFVLLFVATLLAETQIKAELDKASITTDEMFTYKLTITSTKENLPEPKVAEFKGFMVESISQSSSISFAKNETKTTLVYVFVLAPVDTGKFKIDASKITVGGRTYSSQAFQIQVKPGKTKTQTIQPESEEPQYTL